MRKQGMSKSHLVQLARGYHSKQNNQPCLSRYACQSLFVIMVGT